MKVYKVLRMINRTSVGFEGGNLFVLHYPPDKKVVPKIPHSKLFAFTELVDAIRFVVNTSWEIYEAEAENVTNPTFRYLTLYKKFAVKLWQSLHDNDYKDRNRNLQNHSETDVPIGMVLCDSLVVSEHPINIGRTYEGEI